MPRFLLLTLLLFTLLAQAQNPNSDSVEPPLPVEKWSPEVRTVPQTDHFASLPCDKTDSAAPANRAEQAALQKRKHQCLEKMRAFTGGYQVK